MSIRQARNRLDPRSTIAQGRRAHRRLAWFGVAALALLLALLPLPAAGSFRQSRKELSSSCGTAAGSFQQGCQGLSSSYRTAASQGRVTRFQRLTVEDGLSENAVPAIVQDEQGYMWFGTREGLDRYDGYDFTIYASDPADPTTLSNSFITTLYVDRDGTLWIGTFHGGLNRFDWEHGTFTHYQNDPQDPTSLSNNRIRAIAQDQEGNLWIGTHGGGLERFDPQDETFTHYRHDPDDSTSLSSDIVRAIYPDPGGSIWVGTYGGLNALDPATGNFRHYRYSPLDAQTLSDDVVMSIARDGDGDLWVGTYRGLDRLDPVSGTFVRYRHDPADPRSLSCDEINVLYRDRSGSLWIGTETGGLNRLETNGAGAYTFERYMNSDRLPDSLSNNAVRSIYEDQGGVLWVGTYGGGLNKLNPVAAAFGHYRHDPDDANSLIDNNVMALQEDRFGGLWIATLGGLDFFDRANNTFTHYQHAPQAPLSLSNNRVRSLLETGDGTLWIGTDYGGLNRFDRVTGTFTHYQNDPDDPRSLPNHQVMALYEDREGTIWVGTYGGGLSRLEPSTGTFTHYQYNPNDPQSLSDNVVLAILQDQSGTLWVGTESGGLNRFDPARGTFRSYTVRPDVPNSLSHNGVTAIHQDAAGLLWIGTLGGGLNRFDPLTETFTHYSDKQGLPSNRVLGIVEDAAGRLWLSTSNGLARFDPHNETFRNYDAQDGLQGNVFSNGACGQGADGALFFGGANGFNVFYPEQIRDNAHVPPVVITAFKKFNQVVLTDLPADAAIELSYQENFIAFDFAALDYAAPEKNQYAYRLEGFDPDWVYAGTRRYASYTNLRGGTYTFRVRGSNNDGVWNEEGVAVRITVVPPFWERWWFIAGVTLFLAGSALAVYRWRVQAIAARNRELAQQVRERTSEIERRRQVAEGLRDMLAVLNTEQPLEALLDGTVTQACRLIGADAAVLYRFGEGQAFPEATVGMPPEFLELGPLSLSGSPLQQAVREGQVMVTEELPTYLARLTAQDTALSPALQHWIAVVGQHFGARLFVPLIVKGQSYGAIVLYYRIPHDFSEEEIELARSFSNQAALAVENARLRAQAVRSATAAERSRLARELHDAVSQTLFSATLIADVLPRLWKRKPEEGRRRLEELRELTRGALAEMRTLLLELRPAALTEAVLIDLLRQLAESVTGRARIPVIVGSEGDCQLPPEVKVALYRIAQEALNNVVKHARARSATIFLECTVDRVCLDIEDDGRGFDPTAIGPEHLGLGIMQERADTIGAQLEIQTSPEDGTRVRVVWRP